MSECIFIEPDQKQDLTILLNLKLREVGLAKDYADRLNDIFFQLTGKDHDVWERHYKTVEDTPCKSE